ncbi:ROK family protein [Sphingomonas dokdonensis]|uniref:N-acetylglucosamine kinase n=1 Tax=Sphingomonas dokdonensis TaxID=344880 RepID=A0A245ZNH0_9SPHN|nr:ROK family protein [Sphingomonas dokdonensis]OWK31279.1 N-acetyl-D-glucosamine kinase [Sphingomonas dokdonensis]
MRLCADIGGSFVDMGVIDAHGGIHDRQRHPTPVADWPALVALFRDALDRHAARIDPYAPVCLSLAGVVDPASGTIASSNTPSVHGRRFDDFGAALGRPVSIINDADAFALAEATLGAGRGHRRVFGIILGTGVGGGVIDDGAVVVDAHGIGGEWGHGEVLVDSPIAPGSVPVFACGCGRRGCLDTVGGARGMERLHAFLHQARATSVEITDGWIAGDAACTATIDYYTRLLAGPIAMFLNSFPATIVPIGGGLSNCAPLIGLIDRRVRTGMLTRPSEPVVVCTRLRDRAGLLGAALGSGLCLSLMAEEPTEG